VDAATSRGRELEVRRLTITVLNGHPLVLKRARAADCRTALNATRPAHVAGPGLDALLPRPSCKQLLISYCSERKARTCQSLTEGMANNNQWLAIRHWQ
jgi:hypothetical protein